MIVLNKKILKTSKESNYISIDDYNFEEYFEESKEKFEIAISNSILGEFVEYYGSDINITFEKLPTDITKKISYMFSFFDTTILSMTILENYIQNIYTFIKYFEEKYKNFTINIDIPEFNFKLKAKIDNIYYYIDSNNINFFFKSEEVVNFSIINDIGTHTVIYFESLPDTRLNTQQIFFEGTNFDEFLKKYLYESKLPSFKLIIEKEKLSENDYSIFSKEDFKTIEEIINNIPYLLKNNIVSYFKIYSIINNNGLLSDQTLKITFPEFEFDKKENNIYIEYKYCFIDLPLTSIPKLCISIKFKIPEQIKVFEKNGIKQYRLLYNYKENIFNNNDFKKLFSHFSDTKFEFNKTSRNLHIILIINGDKFLEKPSLYIYTKEKMEEIIKNVFYLIFKYNKII